MEIFAKNIARGGLLNTHITKIYEENVSVMLHVDTTELEIAHCGKKIMIDLETTNPQEIVLRICEILKNIDLKENRFGFEPEITAKISNKNVRIFEVGIKYFGRNYSEGKKINWKDGISAIRCIFQYNLFSK